MNITNIGIAATQTGRPAWVWQRLRQRSIEWKLQWLLRLGVFTEFVGHGACGVHCKAAWLPYFQVFAIPEAVAWKLMPVVGAVDIALGTMALLSPRRALLLYMAIWGCFTALLRPAAGQGGWEFIERAYNYGVPVMLLLLLGSGQDRKSWFASVKTVPPLSARRAGGLLWVLRAIVALMLIGHGGYGAFMAKGNLLGFYQAAGLGSLGLPLEAIRAGIGFFEIGLGVAALFTTRPSFFVFIFAWKLASELLYLVAGADLAWWEVLERGGSYVAPLAACCVLMYLKPQENSSKAPMGMSRHDQSRDYANR
jgi:hypothetical protein